ncbi:MAG: hypothetical protein KatS3mg115_0830 [Candidatus Poribacteria bacterium]|nr:MAG: hypothetical protein KatS3mg115_0830 [Candidatus Poribacteria bacterium]
MAEEAALYDVPDRSHLVQYVQDERRRYLMFYGEGWLYESLPKGSRVIYGPEPLPGVPDVRAAVEQAIENPIETEPLSAQLRPGMKVTIVFDDLSLTLPPMRRPDFRQVAIELLLEKLDRAGVEDVHLIAALGIHRRMTPRELRGILGRRIFDRFYPQGRLYNHDAEDPDNLVLLGKTEAGEHVELNRRAVESDLVIYVNLCLTAMDGGHKSLNTGITSYRSLYHHHNPQTLLHARSLMDPRRSALHASLERMGRLVNEKLNVFHIESTYNTATFPSAFSFLTKREEDWSALDKLLFRINKAATETLPRPVIRRVFHSIKAPYGVTSVQAGKTDPVHAITLKNIYRQQLVPVEGQADVLIAGTPYLGPYNVYSILNPLLVHCLMLGYMFNMYLGKPLVREGGVLILAHPMSYEFHEEHHPSYIRFFEEVLPQTRDPEEIFQKYERAYAEDPEFRRRFREGYAFHGAHAMYMWYWGTHALHHLGKVIVLKPENDRAREACRRMGYDTADSLPEALEKAQEVVGADPQITLYHWPPIFLCQVS